MRNGQKKSVPYWQNETRKKIRTCHTEKKNILTFVFEAFDESWKGSPDPHEPEKHWGLFYENRNPKMALANPPGYKR